MTRGELIEKIDAFYLEYSYYTSLDLLCSTIKVSKKTIYRYFHSKEDLIKAIFIHRQSIIENLMVEAQNDNTNALSLMISNNLRLRDYMSPDHQRRNYNYIKKTYPELFQELMKGVEKVILNKMVPIIEKGIEEGTILSDLNPVTVCKIYSEFFLLSRTAEDTELESYERMTDNSVLMFLRSLLTQKGFKIYQQEEERLLANYTIG